MDRLDHHYALVVGQGLLLVARVSLEEVVLHRQQLDCPGLFDNLNRELGCPIVFGLVTVGTVADHLVYHEDEEEDEAQAEGQRPHLPAVVVAANLRHDDRKEIRNIVGEIVVERL